MPSPTCQVKDGAGSYQSTANGVDVTPANTVTINLTNTSGVTSWQLECVYTDETTVASAITSSLSINSTTKTATFTAPAAGKAMIFRSIINGGLGPNLQSDPTYTTTFGVFTRVGANALRVGATNEVFEGDGTNGWTSKMNAAIRVAGTGGGGSTPTGTGLRKVVSGVESAAAALLVNADVASGAAIASSKLAPPGAGSQVVYNSGGSFAATTWTTDGTGISLGSAGYMSLGTTPAASGDIRVTYAGAGTRNIVVVKNSTATDTPIVRTGPGDACAFGNSALDFSLVGSSGTVSAGGDLTLGASGNVVVNAVGAARVLSPLQLGASGWATTGTIRLPYAATDTVINAKGSGGTDIPVLSRVGADSWRLGFGTSAGQIWNVAGYRVNIDAYEQVNITGGAAVAVTSGTNVNLSAGAGYTVALNVSGTTYLYVNGSSTNLEVWRPLGGGVAAATPLKYAFANVTSANGTVVATAAQYSCPTLNLTTGATAAWSLQLPLVAGAEFTIINGSAWGVQCKGATGGITTSIPTGTAYRVVCDGTNYVRVG